MIRNGLPNDVTEQTFQLLALIRPSCLARMQGGTGNLACDISVVIGFTGRQCLQGEHPAPCLGTYRNTISYRMAL
jgi:hypothetical protein